MTIETAQCPRCPAWMIRRPTGRMLMSNPPQTEMEWWCGCGYRAPSEPARHDLADDYSYESWRAVNRQRQREQVTTAERPWWKVW